MISYDREEWIGVGSWVGSGVNVQVGSWVESGIGFRFLIWIPGWIRSIFEAGFWVDPEEPLLDHRLGLGWIPGRITVNYRVNHG